MCDDLGYGDIHCLAPRDQQDPHPRTPTGSPPKGMVFTDAHSGSSVCSPHPLRRDDRSPQLAHPGCRRACSPATPPSLIAPDLRHRRRIPQAARLPHRRHRQVASRPALPRPRAAANASAARARANLRSARPFPTEPVHRGLRLLPRLPPRPRHGGGHRRRQGHRARRGDQHAPAPHPQGGRIHRIPARGEAQPFFPLLSTRLPPHPHRPDARMAGSQRSRSLRRFRDADRPRARRTPEGARRPQAGRQHAADLHQ